MVTLGEKVRMHRIRLGLSQTELAARSGVKQGHISRIEQNQLRNVHVSTVIALAEGLDLPVDALLGSSENGKPEKPRLRDVDDLLRRMGYSETTRQSISHILQSMNPDVAFKSAMNGPAAHRELVSA